MQPGVVLSLVALLAIGALIHQFTRGPLADLPGRRRLRSQYLAGISLIGGGLVVVLARQWAAWRALATLGLPLPPGAVHLVGWPASFADGRAWVIQYHGTITEARQFYRAAAPPQGWRVSPESS